MSHLNDKNEFDELERRNAEGEGFRERMDRFGPPPGERNYCTCCGAPLDADAAGCVPIISGRIVMEPSADALVAELVEACKAASNWIDGICDIGSSRRDYAHYPYAILKALDAAISKAEGKP